MRREKISLGNRQAKFNPHAFFSLTTSQCIVPGSPPSTAGFSCLMGVS